MLITFLTFFYKLKKNYYDCDNLNNRDIFINRNIDVINDFNNNKKCDNIKNCD